MLTHLNLQETRENSIWLKFTKSYKIPEPSPIKIPMMWNWTSKKKLKTWKTSKADKNNLEFLTNSSQVIISVPIHRWGSWVSTLLNILRQFAEEVYCQIAGLHIHQPQRGLFAFISHPFQSLNGCLGKLCLQCWKPFQLLQPTTSKWPIRKARLLVWATGRS